MKTFQWRISLTTKQDNYEMDFFAFRPHVTTLYSALSRHIIRPNPYAAQDLISQIQEHLAVTPRATGTLCLGTLILESLEKLHHHCPTAIPILLNSLWVLTAGRTPRKKVGQDWTLTKKAASILLMNFRGMHSENLARLGANMTETLKTFVQSHLISQGSRWMKTKAYVAWSGVQESITMNLYDMIIEFLGIQNRQDTRHQTEMLQAIADSMGDTTQTEDVTAHGFSILPKLNMGPNSSPLDGVINKALRARWNLNSLSPQLWTQGYRQRKAMHTTGTIFNPDETLQLIHLTAEVMQRHVDLFSILHTHHSLEGITEESASFIQIGSSWLRELTIDNMSNWSLINQLTTELIKNVMTLRQDDPITLGNCMHIYVC